MPGEAVGAVAAAGLASQTSTRCLEAREPDVSNNIMLIGLEVYFSTKFQIEKRQEK